MTGVLLLVRLVVTICYVICNSCPRHIHCMVAHCSFFQFFFIIGVLSFLLITWSKICLNFRLYKNSHKMCASFKHKTNNVLLLFILLIFFFLRKKILPWTGQKKGNMVSWTKSKAIWYWGIIRTGALQHVQFGILKVYWHIFCFWLALQHCLLTPYRFWNVIQKEFHPEYLSRCSSLCECFCFSSFFLRICG